MGWMNGMDKRSGCMEWINGMRGVDGYNGSWNVRMGWTSGVDERFGRMAWTHGVGDGTGEWSGCVERMHAMDPWNGCMEWIHGVGPWDGPMG
eukprot:1998361-Lingulodinium_polyedra.AAC.1